MRDRAHRRFQYQKKIDKWSKIAKEWDIQDDNVRYPGGRHGWVVRSAENMPVCSGPCCGNPRRWNNELTRQEIRAIDNERQQLREYEKDTPLDS